jgi:hypothetical protein
LQRGLIVDTTIGGRIFRGWLAFQFALIGFGLVLMVGIAFVSSLGSSRVPLGLSSMSVFYVLLSACFVFAAIHVIAFLGILRRARRAQLVAASTCFLALVVPATYAIVARRMRQVDVAYSTILGIELILLFMPAVRDEFGPRINTA